MATPSPLAEIRARIDEAARCCGRRQETVALVAVSKTQPAGRVIELLEQGQRRFGENRVQEAMGKFPPLRECFADLRLHLIGPLQTNKARDAVRYFDVIETLDRLKLCDAIARAADQEGRMPQLLVQVNIADEPQKAGVSRAEADAFIATCQARFGASLTGLMCIPPAADDPTPHFLSLARMAARCGLPVLSMGMSDDFETAILAGASEVRIGSALFGARAQAATPANPASAGRHLASPGH